MGRLFEPQPEGNALDRLPGQQERPGVAKPQPLHPMLRGELELPGEMPPQLPFADADLLRQDAGVVSGHSRAVFPVRYGVKTTHSFERLKFALVLTG